MARSGVPGASLLSNNPKINPLGSFGTTVLPIAEDIGAVALAPETGGLSLAVPAIQGGFDFSQGNILGGLGSLASAGLGAYNVFGPSSAATTAAAGGGSALGSAATSPVTGGGTGLSGFLGNIGSDISTGYNNVLNYLGLGGSTAPATAAGTAAGAAVDPTAAAAAGTGAVSPANLASIYSGTTPTIAPTVQAATPAATSLGPATAANLLAQSTTPAAVTAAAPAAASAVPSITAGTAATPAAFSLGSPSTWLPAANAFTTAHPLLTLGAAGIGSQLLAPTLSNTLGGGLTSQEQAMLNAEQPGINAANSLVGSLQSGVLPPGAEASVDQALQADIANIRSRYATTGQSGSSAEAQDIANAQQAAAAQKFTLAQQATNTGLSALGLNQSVYQTLVQQQLNQQQSMQNAFAQLFGSLGLGTALAGSKAP